MKAGINNTRVLNIRLILQKLLQRSLGKEHQISQSDLQKYVAVNTSTVQRICDELLEKKLIRASSFSNKLKGRNPKSYELNPSFGEFIVVTLGTNYFSLFTFDFSMNLLHEEHVNNLEKYTFEEMLQQIYKFLTMRITAKTINCTILLPGTTDNSNTVLLQSYPLHVENITIGNMFKDLNTPFFIENNINGLAIGFAAKEEFGKNFIVIAMGEGVGIGIISNSAIFKGQNGHAGDLGHLFYKETQEYCYCGNSGCIELFLKDASFEKSTKEEYFTIFARFLRNMQLSYDPVKVYLTGSSVKHMETYPELYQSILEKEHIITPTHIETTELDFARGGGVLGFQKFFDTL